MKLARYVLSGIVVLFLLAAGAAGWNAYRVRNATQALISSAVHIRSTEDAVHDAGALKEVATATWDQTSPDGERTMEFQIQNLHLSRFHLVQRCMSELSVGIKGRELRYVTLTMGTENEDKTTTLVWVSEWFGPNVNKGLRTNNRYPNRATIDIGADDPEELRRKAFAFNPDCMAKVTGCSTTEEILPSLRQLGPRR